MTNNESNLSVLPVTLAAGESQRHAITGNRLAVIECDQLIYARFGERQEIPLDLGFDFKQDFDSLTLRNPNSASVSLQVLYGTAEFTDRRLNVVATRPNQFVKFQEAEIVPVQLVSGQLSGASFSGVPNLDYTAPLKSAATQTHGRIKSFLITNEDATRPLRLIRVTGSGTGRVASYVRPIGPGQTVEAPGCANLYLLNPAENGVGSGITVRAAGLYYLNPIDPSGASNDKPASSLRAPVIDAIVWSYGTTEAGVFDATLVWHYADSFWPEGTTFASRSGPLVTEPTTPATFVFDNQGDVQTLAFYEYEEFPEGLVIWFTNELWKAGRLPNGDLQIWSLADPENAVLIWTKTGETWTGEAPYPTCVYTPAWFDYASHTDQTHAQAPYFGSIQTRLGAMTATPGTNCRAVLTLTDPDGLPSSSAEFEAVAWLEAPAITAGSGTAGASFALTCTAAANAIGLAVEVYFDETHSALVSIAEEMTDGNTFTVTGAEDVPPAGTYSAKVRLCAGETPVSDWSDTHSVIIAPA